MNWFKKEKTFEQEIQEVFAEIISNNNFILAKPYKDYDDTYLLSNDIVVLELGYDKGETWCNIKRPTDDRMTIGYELWHVYNFLYPNDKTYITTKANGDWISRYEDLQIYAHMLTHKMAFILKADYFWEKEYLEKKKTEEAKMEFFWALDIDHPIKQKFHNNDSSWYNDLDQYIKANGIVL